MYTLDWWIDSILLNSLLKDFHLSDLNYRRSGPMCFRIRPNKVSSHLESLVTDSYDLIASLNSSKSSFWQAWPIRISHVHSRLSANAGLNSFHSASFCSRPSPSWGLAAKRQSPARAKCSQAVYLRSLLEREASPSCMKISSALSKSPKVALWVATLRRHLVVDETSS